jgi:hypothetical protein
MSGVHSKGAQLQMSDGSATPVFTAIANVTNISGPGITVPIAEATSLDDDWAEKLAGIPDGGQVTLDINYDPGAATHDASTGVLSEIGAEQDFKIVFPDSGATEWDFTAIVAGFQPGMSMQDKVTGSVTLEVTGQPTLV